MLVWGSAAVAATADRRPPVSVDRPQAASHRYRAVAFDYFVLFNPDSVLPVVERVAPGKAREFTNLWRTRQFEYTWLRSITNRYADFSRVTEDALFYAASALQVSLTSSQKQELMNAYLALTPWPDSADALRRLRASSVKVITIANFTPGMLRANADRAGLTPLFDAFVSTDANRSYKPDPRAYALGLERLDLPREDIVFAAFGGWDAAGAKAFGYPTVWVNRFNQPLEQLDTRPDRSVGDLSGLLDFVLDREPAAVRAR